MGEVSDLMNSKPAELFVNKLFSSWRDDEDARKYMIKKLSDGEKPDPAVIASIANATKILASIKDIYNQQQLQALADIASEKVMQIPAEFQDLSQLPKAIKIIDDMQNSLSEAELREAYAALLVSTLDSRRNALVHPYFSTLLKSLSATDILLLEKIYKYSISYSNLENDYFSFEPCENIFPKDAAETQKKHLDEIITTHKHEAHVFEVLLDGGDPYDTDFENHERILWFEQIKRSETGSYEIAMSMEIWDEYLVSLTLLKAIGLVRQDKWGHSWFEPYARFRSNQYKTLMGNCFASTASGEKRINWDDFSDGSNVGVTQVGNNLCWIIFGR